MELALNILQVCLSVLLMASILLQQRGASLGAGFGGEGAVYHTKRGAEKLLFWMTIVLAVLFVVSAVVRLFVL